MAIHTRGIECPSSVRSTTFAAEAIGPVVHWKGFRVPDIRRVEMFADIVSETERLAVEIPTIAAKQPRERFVRFGRATIFSCSESYSNNTNPRHSVRTSSITAVEIYSRYRLSSLLSRAPVLQNYRDKISSPAPVTHRLECVEAFVSLTASKKCTANCHIALPSSYRGLRT